MNLQRSVSQESVTIQQLNQSSQTLRSDKLLDMIRSRYPVFGQHLVLNEITGYIDTSKKKPQDFYVGIDLRAPDGKPLFTDEQFASVIKALQDHGFTVFPGGFDLQAVTSKGAINIDNMGPGSCILLGHAREGAPCVLYFRPELKDRALALKPLLAKAEEVPNDQIVYVAPDTLNATAKELISKSGVDIMIVLGE